MTKRELSPLEKRQLRWRRYWERFEPISEEELETKIEAALEKLECRPFPREESDDG